MTIIPAIDLLDGRCVRLLRGSYSDRTLYSESPADVARSFERLGASWIHIVDLNAARSGGGRRDGVRRGDGDTDRAHNRDRIREIRAAVSCRLEVGGGVRTETDVDELLDAGADRLVVGTVLARDPDRVAAWVDRHGSRFFAGIDALDGQVMVQGWETGSGIRDTDLARRARDIGVAGVIYTNISRDGAMAGPDIASTNRVAESVDLPVILSGGISGRGDVESVFGERHQRVAGIIIGKALYEHAVDLTELVERFERG